MSRRYLHAEAGDHGKGLKMEIDLSEEAFELRDPWRLALRSASDYEVAESGVDFSRFDTAETPFHAQKVVHEDLKLPEPSDFQYGALQDLPSLEQSEVTDDGWRFEDNPAPIVADKDEHDNLWDDIATVPPCDGQSKLLSWGAFQEPGKVEPLSAYMSEAGNAAFDVALRMQQSNQQLPDEISVIRNDIFLRSLFALGLGRSSALFTYDAKRKQFQRTNQVDNVSGLSKQSADSLVETLTSCGRLVRHLRDFVDRTYAPGKAFPAKVALANTVTTILDALERQLIASWHEVQSLLQLQSMFERPHRMLVEVYDLARTVRNARTNEDLASLVYKRCQYCDQEPDWLRSLLLQILSRVSQPWLEFAEQWAGFKDDIQGQNEGTGNTFVQREEPSDKSKAHDDDLPKELQYTFRPERLPLFMSRDDGQMLFNIGRDVRILRTHHPDHPLAQTSAAVNSRAGLKWQTSWEHVDRVAAKAKEFENMLTKTVQQYRPSASNTRAQLAEAFGDELGTEDPFDPFTLDSADTKSALPDELFDIITSNLSTHNEGAERADVNFAPPTALLPVLSFNPLLLAQQRILNAVMIRKYFRSHDLRLHLDMQRNFHLFGDGVFVSQLTAALFDPEQASTERQRGVMRSGTGMGLRLGSRGTWPPASSELRLAMMGILSDCYDAAFQLHAQRRRSSGHNRQDLPGSLSFAVRQLSEEEAEKILDADSLHALDFLRLQYSAPSPLGAILTPASLDRYDTIFKFLLRLVRLLFVVSHLPRNLPNPHARLFRWQADAFVTTCCNYFFKTGVQATWSTFTSYLDSIERRLIEEDNAGELGTRVQEGVEDVRKQHDLCLEKMAFALLLRMRQQKVMKVLENVFTTVLDFSKLAHATTGDSLGTSQVLKLHKTFDENVKLFIEVCRGLAGKRAYGKSGATNDRGDENTIEQLVVALDYNGFYERRD